MSRIKKFDLYLLERFPLLWHTKICYMLLYSIFISILFYCWGYFYTNQYQINNQNINRYFEDSFASFFLVIFFIIGVTFWALSYFKKNAVKNYYPLQRFYFTKLFFSLLIIFWSLSWPYNAFNWGVDQKVRTLVSMEDLSGEIETINLANAFLPSSNTSYEVESYITLKHPEIKIYEMDVRDSSWTSDYGAIYEDSSTFNYPVEYFPKNYPDANSNIGGRTFQFLGTRKICTEDSCNSRCLNLVVKTHNYSDLTTHKLYDLKNYAYEFLAPSYFNYPDYNIFESYKAKFENRYYYYDYDLSEVLSLDLNKKLNKVIENSAPDGISSLVKKYERFLRKYRIRHHLEVDTILNYLSEHPNSIAMKSIVSNESWSLKAIQKGRLRFSSFEEYQEYRNSEAADNTYHYNYPPAYFVEQSEIRTLFENVKQADYPYIDWEHLITSLGFAIALSFLFILFSFSDLITLLLAIPFGGILLVANILFAVFLTSFGIRQNFELKISLQIMLFMGIMYGLLFLFYYSKKVHKRILDITFYLCFIITIMLPHAILFLMDNLLKYKALDSCGYEYTKHSIFFYWLTDPLFIILLPLASMLLFMKLIKPISSKAD